MNLALICKLTWRFIENKEAVWVKLLSTKHIMDENFWSVAKPEKCSAIWSSLLEVRHILANIIFWQVVNGERILIWDDPWLFHHTDHILGFPTVIMEGIDRVSDLLLPDSRNWNVDLLNHLFSPEVVNCITAVYISPAEVLSHGKNYGPSLVFFRRFSFIWKLLNNGIAVKSNIKRFVNHIQSHCTFYCVAEESILHLIFECPKAILVFNQAGLAINAQLSSGNVMHIISELMESNVDNSFIMRVCIIWNLWKLRNVMVFSNEVFSVNNVFHKAYQDFKLCLDNSAIDEHQISELTSSNNLWIPPEPHYVKINVDAAFIPNNGAAGDVAQYHNGNFLECATITFDATSPLLAEKIACKLGVEAGIKFGFNKVVIEGDASNVTDAVLGASRDIPWSIRSVILKVKDAIPYFVYIKFQCVPKSANYLAHELCQYAMHENVNNWWNGSSPPPCISANLNLTEVVE
ncbi:uncharacterized protein LOC113272538 [Papaver somniferum]|uniref:uncharacterized protein LOC113272538 n=1 Tax=Papaver somniferum TaxID=3469 RepID=UPI000E6F6DA0|nr:uncharacterized protein LOC113272538 [Papaver somniferum]